MPRNKVGQCACLGTGADCSARMLIAMAVNSASMELQETVTRMLAKLCAQSTDALMSSRR